MKMDKKRYPQVYLEEWIYDVKKTKMTRFADADVRGFW